MKTNTFICPTCGKLKSSGAWNTPHCQCGAEMVSLGAREEAAASTQIKGDAKRLKWFRAGCKYRRENGRRKWRPVFK